MKVRLARPWPSISRNHRRRSGFFSVRILGAQYPMLVRPHLPGYRWFHFLRNAAVRTGVYVGVCLTLVFAAWLIIANHAPLLERFAMGRNIAAAAIFCFLALI